MHQCLSCNQPCSLLSPFCEACRAALLARRDQESPEVQPEMVRAVGGKNGENGYPGWEVEGGSANLTAFPQPEAALVGAQAEQGYAQPPGPEEENGGRSFEASLYTMETLEERLTEVEYTENKAEANQLTHVFAVPPRPRRVMPRNVKRALVVFCVVGVLALLTDGILLALSLTRHHIVAHTQEVPLNDQRGQRVASPVDGGSSLTPTSEARVSLLALSSQRLTFNATQGQTTLAPQNVTLAATRQGFSWRADAVNTAPAWVRLSAWHGSVEPNVTASFAVSVRPADLAPGFYTANIQVKAVDTQGKALVGSPMTLIVNLNVHPPCVLNIVPDKLSFVSVLGSEPSPQTLMLSEASSCAFPLSWQVSSDASWATFSRSSGIDNASGNLLIVQASASGKLIGSYVAHITFQGTDSSGVPFVMAPATITVTLTVIA